MLSFRGYNIGWLLHSFVYFFTNKFLIFLAILYIKQAYLSLIEINNNRDFLNNFLIVNYGAKTLGLLVDLNAQWLHWLAR